MKNKLAVWVASTILALSPVKDATAKQVTQNLQKDHETEIPTQNPETTPQDSLLVLSWSDLVNSKLFFNNTLQINSDTFNIDSIFVDNEIIDNTEKYTIKWDFSNLDTKYKEKFDNATPEINIEKLYTDNKTYLKITDFKIENPDFNQQITENWKYIILNDLLVFEKTGDNSRKYESSAKVSIDYDQKETENRIQETIGNMWFKINTNAENLSVNNDLMKHINIQQIVQESFILLKSVEKQDNEITKRTRKLVVKDKWNFKEITKIPYNYDEDSVSVSLWELPNSVVSNINGFDAELQFIKNGNNLEIVITNEKEFADYMENLFTDSYELLNKTNLADKDVYENLNKTLIKKPWSIAKYAMNPELLNLWLVKWITVNIWSEKSPIIVHISKDWKLVFVDNYNKENTWNIELMDQKDPSIMRSMEITAAGLSVQTKKWETPDYEYLTFKWDGATQINNSKFNYDETSLKITTAEWKSIWELVVKQDAKEWYSVDLAQNRVELKSEYFYYLLPELYDYRSNRINISNDKIKSKFDEEFQKVVAKMKDKTLEGVILGDRFYSLGIEWEGSTVNINSNCPEEIKECVKNIKDFIGYMIRLSRSEWYFINDPKDIQSKNVSKEAKPLFDHISWPFGMWITSIEWFDEFSIENKTNTITIKIRDGYWSTQDVSFEIGAGRPKITTDKITIWDTDYQLNYQSYWDDIYLIPTKEK